MKKFFQTHRWTLISILIITPVGFYSKYYQGPANTWVNNSLGGLFYEIFWCLVIFLFLSRVPPHKIALSVLVVTCALEFLQLWHPAFLEVIRSNLIGRTIIGTSFILTDFLYYIAGSIMGWWWIKLLKEHQK